MISKADAEKLIESIEAIKFTPRSYFIDVVNFEMTCNVINAMTEPDSPEPEPSPKLFKPGEIDPNVKCHRCGDMGGIDDWNTTSLS